MKHWFIAVLALSMAACSSDDDGSGSSSSSTSAIKAPMLMTVEPMEGALHVMWMNMQADAESVDAERKMDNGPFELAFTVPGALDNKMDAAATDDMPYTYRLRAKKGTDYSAYSNEMTANPQDKP